MMKIVPVGGGSFANKTLFQKLYLKNPIPLHFQLQKQYLGVQQTYLVKIIGLALIIKPMLNLT